MAIIYSLPAALQFPAFQFGADLLGTAADLYDEQVRRENFRRRADRAVSRGNVEALRRRRLRSRFWQRNRPPRVTASFTSGIAFAGQEEYFATRPSSIERSLW